MRFDLPDINEDTFPVSTERREQAREKAKALRAQHKKSERRGRLFLRVGILVAVVAVAAIVAVSIISTIRPPSSGPLNMLSDGIQIGAGLEATQTAALRPGAEPVPNVPGDGADILTIVVYMDYFEPAAAEFSVANNDQISTWVDTGAATIEFHPISMLNSKSQGSQYSTRAANAAGCVANYDPNSFYDFHRALLADQPAETSTGLSDDELIERARSVGVSSMGSVSDCVRDIRFKNWVNEASARALAGPIPNTDPVVDAIVATPTVLVNGLQYTGAPADTQAFSTFVVQAAGQSFTDASTETPVPTDSPVPTETATPSPTPTSTP
jgi:protein-disulfide isomerase